MILSPMNVELTKVHYYESFRKHRNREHQTLTISEIVDNKINKNINISRNIFGQKSWTLNVTQSNDNDDKKRFALRTLPLVLTVFIALVVFLLLAVVSVIYMKQPTKTREILTRKLPNRVVVFDQTNLNIESVLRQDKQKTHRKLAENVWKTQQERQSKTVCNCTTTEVCLRTARGLPECTPKKDARDPSGCGGLCEVNHEHCRLLEKRLGVYECAPNGAGLHCPLGYVPCEGKFCLHISQLCDGRGDCGDLSDEKNCSCDLNENFQCGSNTSCLSKTKRCDGKLDCWDNSDEVECNRGIPCAQGSFPCGDATGCFKTTQFCDGVYDCVDQSDELCL